MTTLTTVSSTDKKQKIGAASKETFELGFLCVDDACTSVYQRSHITDGRTRLFTVSGNTWSSKTTRKGPCVAPATGSFVVSENWTWTNETAGTMVGTRDNKATGCKSDGVSRQSYTLTARTGDLPYLAPTEAAPLKTILSEYDAKMKPLYAQYPTCDDNFYGDETAAGGACFGKLFATWEPALAALDTALDQNPVPAPVGACKKAADRFPVAGGTSPLDKLRAGVAAVAPAMDAAAAANDYESANKKLSTALDLQGAFQSAFLALVLQCVAPNDLAGLGADGELATDVDKTIPVLPAG